MSSARAGRAPAPAAGGEHAEDVAGLEVERALVPQAFRRCFISTWQEPVLAGRSRFAAGKTPRAGHPPLGDQADGHVLEHEQIAFDAVATGSRTRAATSASNRIAEHP